MNIMEEMCEIRSCTVQFYSEPTLRSRWFWSWASASATLLAGLPAFIDVIRALHQPTYRHITFCSTSI